MEKVQVNPDLCISCGMCVMRSEKYFEFNDEAKSQGKNVVVEEEDKKELLDIVESCPTEAITIIEEKVA